MELQVIFVGYNDFISKKNDKHYNMLKFITEPKIADDGSRADCEMITVFEADDMKYNDFIKNNNILSRVSIKVSVNGTQVRYSL